MNDLQSMATAAGMVVALPWHMPMAPTVFLYLGPETIMPVASILASIIGVVLLFWRLILGAAKRTYRRLSGAAEPEPDTPGTLNLDAQQPERPE
jgi:hypothetical protein